MTIRPSFRKRQKLTLMPSRRSAVCRLVAEIAPFQAV
jgi:hypothetical protein